MRVCPKCGFKEALIWRNRTNRLYTQYCKLDELADWEPEITEKLNQALKETPKRFCDIAIDGYIYHITKGRHVEKIWHEDTATGHSFHEPTFEKTASLKWRNKHRKGHFQRRLLESIQENSVETKPK